MTIKCPKFLSLIHFLSFSIASTYFRLTNLLTITLLSWPLLFLERESVTTLNISSIHNYSRLLADVKNSILQIFITDAVWYAYNSTLFLQLNCSPFAWFFSKFIILFSNLLFKFFVVTSSLVSFLFSNEIWSIASVSLCIWLDSLCKKIYISSIVENGKYMNYQYNSEQMFIICSNRIKIKYS